VIVIDQGGSAAFASSIGAARALSRPCTHPLSPLAADAGKRLRQCCISADFGARTNRLLLAV
jgi:hypothetical protein